MPLRFSGESGGTEQFEMLLEAYDDDKRVPVVASREAVDDHGLSAVQTKASDKYDAKQFDPAGR